MKIDDYVASFYSRFFFLDESSLPWQVTARLASIIERLAGTLEAPSYQNSGGVWIHNAATIETGATIKAPAVISDGCFIASTAYIRGGVFLGEGVTVGPGCEVKSSVIMTGSTLAHLNFVGDSIVGGDVNIEAGAVIANHYNERREKEVRIYIRGREIHSGSDKFGALIGDYARIGANAVLSPGTILDRSEIVGRLALVDQATR